MEKTMRRNVWYCVTSKRNWRNHKWSSITLVLYLTSITCLSYVDRRGMSTLLSLRRRSLHQNTSARKSALNFNIRCLFASASILKIVMRRRKIGGRSYKRRVSVVRARRDDQLKDGSETRDFICCPCQHQF